MAEARIERRLAAILAADVAGYSRLMGADEVGTLAALKAHRREIVDPAIAAHKGRIVKTTGDGMLVEFASAVDAVTCAVAVQEKMAEQTGDGTRIQFRLGINVGDIIIDGDDIFGDGVNVAARVENECQPGCVCLAGSAFEQVRDKISFVFDDLGEKSLKNIDRPVRLYALRAALMSPAAAARSPTEAINALPMLDKPSIAVLPFQNMSGDPEQEYFADGMVEDIITDLSKVSALNVASRNSAFTFKGKSVEVPEVGRKLGVSYVLEGSVRKAGNRVRITAQLLEAASDTHVWAERWDRDLTDIFALQDEISQAIVAALKLKLLPQEKKALEKRGTANAEAYDLCLMARNLYDTGNYTAENQERIIRFIDRSLAIDPNYALAWALKARAQSALVRKFGRAGDDGAAAAERALELDPNLAEAHAVKARRLHTEGDGEAALAELELALRLDPDSPYVRFTAGTIHYQNRRFDLAAAAYEAAVKLDDSMIDPAFMLYSAYLALGDRERARAAATFALARVEKVLEHDRANGDAMAAGVGALMVLGEVDRAREWMKRALLLDPDNPSMHYNFACALSRDLGDADGALELLTVALAKDKDPTGDNLRVALTDPDLDPIRGDPRFQALLTKTEARLAKA